MRAAVSGLWRRVGRRGCALLFFAFLDLVYCVSLLHPPPEARASASLAFLAGVVPLPAWAVLWGVVGLLCLTGAFRRDDTLAFAAAIGLKTLWGLIFLLGWWFAGLERAYVGAAVWLAMAGWVVVIAGWPEDPRSLPTPARKG